MTWLVTEFLAQNCRDEDGPVAIAAPEKLRLNPRLEEDTWVCMRPKKKKKKIQIKLKQLKNRVYNFYLVPRYLLKSKPSELITHTERSTNKIPKPQAISTYDN